MTEAGERRHGLEPFLESTSHGGTGQDIVEIRIQPDLMHINLRGDPENGSFIKAVTGVLGQEMPSAPNTTTADTHKVFWLGPDEWLILTQEKDLADKLRESLAGIHATMNDVSGGQVALRVAGAHVADILAKGCTLDLHPTVFRTGMCAQSGLAKANVLIALSEQDARQSVFDIVVRRSFSDYLVRWLDHAATEFGTAWSTS